MTSSILKSCTKSKSILFWRDDSPTKSRFCDPSVTSSKVSRIIGIYDDISDINPTYWKNSYSDSWTSRAKIGIWITGIGIYEDPMSNVELESILETFWSMDSINVALITMPFCATTMNCTDKSLPRIFTYDPFSPRLERPDKRGKLIELQPDEPWFSDKLKNLRSYPISVSMYHQEPHAILNNFTDLSNRGIEVKILRYISGKLNFA